jgi:gliding motility-associated-like protein
LKRILFIFSGLFLSLLAGMPQNVSMPGNVNHFLKVTAVSTGSDRVTVATSTEMTYFQPGDKVLLIQMTGTDLADPPGLLTNANRFQNGWNNAGMYEILQVDQTSSNEVVFTDNISRAYTTGEKIQLVRFVEGDNVTITAPVNAAPWDGNTGGIVAILGMDSVILKASIDASSAGFRGGTVPAENYTGGCRKDVNVSTLPWVLDTLYFLPSQVNRSGNKGEGIVTTLCPYTKGSGFAINGGGAGNGLYSGGAGGSNYRQGGDGGQQSTACTETLYSSWGGYACKDLYATSRVIMGGGGGTGVKSSTNTASNGGNGGGLVFILTGVLDVRNGSYIWANGQNVTTTVTGSGGGGGAGGTVLLDVTSCPNSFWIRIHGGSGGKVSGTPCSGSGGGGSGGVLWHSGSSIPVIIVDSTFGAAGHTTACVVTDGSPGSYGGKIPQLISPLTGFLFNSIRGVDTLCAGQTLPNPLKGSQPKGGNGIYAFHWEQSTDKVNWIPALGTADLRTLNPPALNQTTWYRRIVSSVSTFDTSRTVEILVYPALTNNIISGIDTLCYDLPAKTLTGTTPAGGNNVYNYEWQYSTNQSDWTNSDSSNSAYNPGKLQQSRFFRRIVTSAAALCTHTSNSVKIEVLPSITSNDFVTSDTVLCDNQGPGLLKVKTPENGDGTYSYQWQNKTLTGSWTSIPSTNLMQYNPGILTDTTFYRRIVFSGNDKACKDTSDAKAIYVLPAITNNLPTTTVNRYCAGEIPLMISGAQPLGGDGTYTYQWQWRTSGNWDPVPGATLKDYIPDKPLEISTQFNRLVTSGKYNACRDTSVALLLDVVPYIVNNIALSDQIICENSTPLPFNTSPATGGLGGFTYQWIQQEAGNTGWESVPGSGNQISYSPGPLSVTTLFARIDSSDICSKISDTVTVTVYPSISNNYILGGDMQYTCYNSGKSLTGSTPANGNGNYLYQWEQSINRTDWNQVDGNGKDYTSPDLTTTQYFRRVVFSSPALHECADTTDPVEVRINPLPSGDVISTVDTLCAGETLQVKFNTAGIHPPFAVTIGDQTKQGITASPDSMAFEPLVTQTYTMISIEDDSGCVADPAGYNKQALVVVYQVPVANAGPDDELCSNTYALQATKSITGSVGNWTASGAAFSDPADIHSSVTVDQYGTNTFTWTETNWHCADDDQVQVIFYEQPQTPDAGPDQVLDFVYTTQLQAIAPAVGSGKWTVVNGSGIFNNDTLSEALVSELDNSNTLQWTVHNGQCTDVSDKMDILISPLVIPKGFTPNGDTKNDIFDLGAKNAEKIKIKIYNSTGILVFESDNYQESTGWDGKNMNGVELPEGTYFYVADIKVAGREKEFQFRSFVEILR